MLTVKPALLLRFVRPPALVFAFLCTVGIAPAQEPAPLPDWEGRSVARILFDPPGQPISAAALEKMLPFRVGSKLTSADVRAAIQRLYQTGRFSDVSIEGEPVENDSTSMTVRIATQFNYFVSRVSFSGVADPPTRGQLATAAKLELGSQFNEGELEQARENIPSRLRPVVFGRGKRPCGQTRGWISRRGIC